MKDVSQFSLLPSMMLAGEDDLEWVGERCVGEGEVIL